MLKNTLFFAGFAAIAAVMNAVVFPGPLEGPYAEGVGKAVACWLLAYLLTKPVKRKRGAWLFGTAFAILMFALFVMPGMTG